MKYDKLGFAYKTDGSFHFVYSMSGHREVGVMDDFGHVAILSDISLLLFSLTS